MNTPRRRSILFQPRAPQLSACALALLWSAAPAWAQVAPAQVDPGALQRQEAERRRYLEEQSQPKELPAVIQQAAPQAPAAAPLAGAKFVLNQVLFGPSALLPETELKALAAPYIGREVDFAALTRLVEQVNALYRAHGIVTARALIGAQKIDNGVVTVTLVEARLERIGVEGNSYTRADHVSSMFADQQGQTLDTRALETRIMAFNRAGDLRVKASLRPGATQGATDLMLSVIEPARYQNRVFLNNEGSRSVGAVQGGIDSSFGGPFGIGDRVSVYVARTRGATSGALSYALPFNRYGGRLSASFSQGSTDVVAGPYRALGINGRSKALQLGVVQPLWRSGGWWFDLASTVGKTRSKNRIGEFELSNTDINNQSLGAVAAGSWDGRSVNLAFTATHAREEALAKPVRRFNIRQMRASWVESLDARHFSVLRTVAQDTSVAVLTPSLLFQVGGVGTVRGYEVGALSGDRGYLVNLELHRALRADIDASVFADVGQVRTLGLPHQSARSAGAALDVQLRGGFNANLTAARTNKQVLPVQAKWRMTARLSYDF